MQDEVTTHPARPDWPHPARPGWHAATYVQADEGHPHKLVMEPILEWWADTDGGDPLPITASPMDYTKIWAIKRPDGTFKFFYDRYICENEAGALIHAWAINKELEEHKNNPAVSSVDLEIQP